MFLKMFNPWVGADQQTTNSDLQVFDKISIY